MPPTIILLFKAFRISFVSLYVALPVVDLVLKLNCSSAKILSLLRCSKDQRIGSICLKHLQYLNDY
jgi:hypothetical protein